MLKILIVEDEVKTAESISQALSEEEYETATAYDGTTALSSLHNQSYDLLITDIILPGISGIELCREVRKINDTMPILMLTALGSIDDKVAGLDAGADDYLPKPFELKELFARVKALLRRNHHHGAPILTIADLTLNLDTKTANRGGKEISLTAKEFALLEYMIRNQGRVLSKDLIASKVWGIDFESGTNVVEVYVNYLRKKIDKDFPTKLLHTQFGLGYILKES
jgi:two-component system copper resistance phosphate regulon response regulator CusR